MRYKEHGLEIRSENAAKSIAQPSKGLVEWISRQERVSYSLDFGCGKLRYSGYLEKISDSITVVDSAIQLKRIQKIESENTTVLDYIKRWTNARALNLQDFREDRRKYDLALCSNVLSAIPNQKAQSQALSSISDSLSQTGKCLFVTQYNNSYFKKASSLPNAISHFDGWIMKSTRGNSYYGIIPLEKLVSLVESHEMKVMKKWRSMGSAFVLAMKRK